MQYDVTLKATVEAESAEAAEQLVFDKAADSAGEVDVTAIPTKEWNVGIQLKPVLTFCVNVNAESAEDAESKAYELVEKEVESGSGIHGALDLAEDYEVNGLEIEASYAIPLDDEEVSESAQVA